jgi:Fe-S-cluster-containing dehydrogenase component
VAFAGAAVAVAKPLAAAEARVAPADAVGLLYDTTKCIGCKACVAACRDANGLEPDTSFGGGRYHAPVDLSARAKTVIKIFDDG